MGKEIHLIYSLLLDTTLLISLIVFLLNYKKLSKYNYLRLFPIYTTASLLEGLVPYFKIAEGVSLIANIFIIFEILFFFNFCRETINGKNIPRLLNLLTLAYVPILTIYLLIANEKTGSGSFFYILTHQGLGAMFVVECVFIVIPILLYFKSIYKSPIIHNISTNPVFLIFAGMFICFSISIPIYCFGILLSTYDKTAFLFLYSINAFGYITMHLFFIKAYLNSK